MRFRFFLPFRFFLRSFAFSFFFLRFRFFFGRFRVNGCRNRCISFSSLSYNMTLFSIKNQTDMLYTYFQRQSKYCLYVRELFVICRLLYNAPIEMRSFASWFFAFAFFLRFLRFCFFAFSFFASLFSEICVFVL